MLYIDFKGYAMISEGYFHIPSRRGDWLRHNGKNGEMKIVQRRIKIDEIDRCQEVAVKKRVLETTTHASLCAHHGVRNDEDAARDHAGGKNTEKSLELVAQADD
ncbi:unnamed protein product [Calypogeia fissa]